MGTRSMHVFPSPTKGKWITQYFQFDGSPTYQLEKFLRDSQCFLRNFMLIIASEKKMSPDNVQLFTDYLRKYYAWRSFDTYHSIGNSREVDSYALKDFQDEWCEWAYEWDDNANLKITRLEGDYPAVICPLTDLTKFQLDGPTGWFDESNFKKMPEIIMEEFDALSEI
jgi:hypothetical protein